MIEYERIREAASMSIQSLYPPDRRHKGIVCPLCGNGQGKDGDGVTFVKGSDLLKCFRCGFSGDIIKLTATAKNISYREAADILAEKLGLTDEKYQRDKNRPIEKFAVPKFEHAKEIVQEEKVDQTEYFKKIEKFLSQTKYPAKRGLSEETCRHFHIGYDAIWKHPKVPKAPTSPRLIIPTSKYSYLARDVRENLSDDQKRYSKQKFGSVALFNPEALEYEFVFITEGEIDAISFYEVCRVNALALGSVSNIQKLADYLKTAVSRPKFVIAALDNDKAGHEGNLKLKQAIKEFGINTLIADFIYTDIEKNVHYKDANEILVKNREAFIENIELIREIPTECYSSDKPASQFLKEMGFITFPRGESNEMQGEFEPYSDEELSKMITEPEFTKENLQSMFEEENFTSEELEQMLSKNNPKPVNFDRVKNEYDDIEKSFLNPSGDDILGSAIPKPNDAIIKKVEEAKAYLNSLTELSQQIIYSPEVMREWAFCYLYDTSAYLDFFDRIANHINTDELDYVSLREHIVHTAVSILKELTTSTQNSAEEENETFSSETLSPPPTVQTQISAKEEKEELLKQPQSPERDKKIISLIQQSLERDHHGNVKSTSVNNFELALNFDPIIRGCVGYDAFSQKIVACKKLPWTNNLGSQNDWSNYDDACLQNYLNRTYGLNDECVFFNVIYEYAHKNSFHPVRDYFKNLPKWDGITRAAEFFIDNLKIEDSKHTREIIKSWMTAAVARVFHPGCKWNYTLTIKGTQSIGSSTVFSKLAGQWFNVLIENIGGKETAENLLGSWIIELREVQAVEETFLSKQADSFCVPYGRRTEKFLRQCVFAATISDEEILRKNIGDQHFFILFSKAEKEFFKKKLAECGTDHINNIWAEIFFYYNQLFDNDKSFDADKLPPSDETLKKAEKICSDFSCKVSL